MVGLALCPATESRVAAVRRFSRFYTTVIGALQEGLLQSKFSLTEARVLFELANHEGATASMLCRELALDAGYLSRILQRFEQQHLIERAVSTADRRQSTLALTAAGRAAFAPLDARSQAEVRALLAGLAEDAQVEVVQAMARIEALLGAAPSVDWRLRQPQPGDIGWVVARHGALYGREYGFDARLEALAARVAGAFLQSHDPTRERCWIAEHGGVNLGSAFLVRADDDAARLRLLLVEPAARGLGIGKRLVAECIAFAHAAGYRRIKVQTNSVLVAARGIYQAAGFSRIASKPFTGFGPAIIGEDWELQL